MMKKKHSEETESDLDLQEESSIPKLTERPACDFSGYDEKNICQKIEADLKAIGFNSKIKIKKVVLEYSGIPTTKENIAKIKELGTIDFAGIKLYLYGFGAPGELYFQEVN
jgi:hypothetical protein